MRKPLIPVIFLACANSYQDGRRLSYLVQERRSIARILAQDEENGYCEVVQEGNTSQAFFFESLRKRKYKDRISIVHFAGHADGAQLRFESESGDEEVMDIETLAGFLQTLSGLHLVFLNGCGTEPIVRQLLDAGIPAVIATETAILDDQAYRVAEAFYNGIAGGFSIRESFEQARAIAGAHYRFREVPLNSYTRSLDWDALETESEEFPWGLYVSEDQEYHLDWRIDRINSGKSSGFSIRKPQTLLTLAALVLLLVIGGFTAASFYQEKKDLKNPYGTQDLEAGKVKNLSFDNSRAIQPDTTLQDSQTIERPATMLRDSSVFVSDATYNILILPLQAYESCTDEATQYEKAMRNRLNELRRNHGIRAEIQFQPGIVSVNDDYNAEDIGRARHADMVIWGEYSKKCGDSTSMSIQYQAMDTQGESIFDQPGEIRATTFKYFTRRYQDRFIQPVADIMYWVHGNEKLQDKRYQQALNLFQQIKVKDLPAYAPVYTQKGLCFLELHNRIRAEQQIDKALQLNSQYGPAYCYKGHINWQRGNMDEAWVDYSRAIDHQSGYAEAYFSRGLVHEKVNKFEEAIQDYEEAFRLNPQYQEARERSKVVRQTTKELRDLNRQITQNPENAELYFEKAKLLQYQLANHDSALAYYDKGIVLKDNYAHGYFERGHLYQYHFLMYDAAISDYEKGLALKPDYRFALGNLAVIYAKRRDDKHFFQYIERALQNGYNIKFFLEKAISKPYQDMTRFQDLLQQYE